MSPCKLSPTFTDPESIREMSDFEPINKRINRRPRPLALGGKHRKPCKKDIAQGAR